MDNDTNTNLKLEKAIRSNLQYSYYNLKDAVFIAKTAMSYGLTADQIIEVIKDKGIDYLEQLIKVAIMNVKNGNEFIIDVHLQRVNVRIKNTVERLHYEYYKKHKK